MISECGIFTTRLCQGKKGSSEAKRTETAITAA
jgi:hypothetical protein